MKLQIKPGKVLSYDRACGVVEIDGSRKTLGASYFHMGRPARSPKAGDLVDVILSERSIGPAAVVYVRPRRTGCA